MRVLPISLALFVFLVGARLAAAGQNQATPSSVSADGHAEYVQAAVIITVAPEGIANHRVTPPISGSTVGVSGAAGTFLLSALAVEAELVLERTISTPQHFSYNWSEDYTGQSRDLLLNGNVRWCPRGTRYLEVIGGGGLAVSGFAERSIVRTDFYPTKIKSVLPDETTTSLQPTVGGGVAIRFPVNRRLEIGPSFRMRWVRRSADELGSYSGVGSYAYHFGAVLRFKL